MRRAAHVGCGSNIGTVNEHGRTAAASLDRARLEASTTTTAEGEAIILASLEAYAAAIRRTTTSESVGGVLRWWC